MATKNDTSATDTASQLYTIAAKLSSIKPILDNLVDSGELDSGVMATLGVVSDLSDYTNRELCGMAMSFDMKTA